MMRTIVKVAFADRDNFAIKYAVGEELKDFDEDRIAKLVERGLVTVEGNEDQGEEDEAPRLAAEIIAKVKESTNADELLTLLHEENSAEKPRSTVVKAIEDRIAKLSESTE